MSSRPDPRRNLERRPNGGPVVPGTDKLVAVVRMNCGEPAATATVLPGLRRIFFPTCVRFNELAICIGGPRDSAECLEQRLIAASDPAQLFQFIRLHTEHLGRFSYLSPMKRSKSNHQTRAGLPTRALTRFVAGQARFRPGARLMPLKCYPFAARSHVLSLGRRQKNIRIAKLSLAL